MKKNLSIFILTINSILLYAQDKPNYPQLTDGIKRVDIKLPKIQNSEDYKVEVSFGLQIKVSECSDVKKFSFNKASIIQEFGLPHRYLYYTIAENQPVEISSNNNVSNCDKTKMVTKKVTSYQNVFIDYYDNFPIPFFIPKNWTLEYRIWRAQENYKTLN